MEALRHSKTATGTNSKVSAQVLDKGLADAISNLRKQRVSEIEELKKTKNIADSNMITSITEATEKKLEKKVCKLREKRKIELKELWQKNELNQESEKELVNSVTVSKKNRDAELEALRQNKAATGINSIFSLNKERLAGSVTEIKRE